MRELGVDIIVESTGKFRTPELLDPYFERGVRKVIVAAPVSTVFALAAASTTLLLPVNRTVEECR